MFGVFALVEYAICLEDEELTSSVFPPLPMASVPPYLVQRKPQWLLHSTDDTFNRGGAPHTARVGLPEWRGMVGSSWWRSPVAMCHCTSNCLTGYDRQRK